MIRRLFWGLLGLGAGVVLGGRLVRQVDRVSGAARPGAMAERAGRGVGSASGRLARAVEAGRAHARQRERELRDAYGIPTIAEVAELGGDGATARAPGSGGDTTD